MLYRCKYCKQKVEKLQIKIPQVCKECVVIHFEANKEKLLNKAKKQVDNKKKKERAELKESLKSISKIISEIKPIFQKYIRLRDKDLPCISCGNAKTTDWAGGHYFSAGIYSGLMFDERNCHKQCNNNCNKHLSGNLLEYRKGLILRYGMDFVNQLESESNEKRNYKYTKEQLIAKKLQYDIKIKEMLKF